MRSLFRVVKFNAGLLTGMGFLAACSGSVGPDAKSEVEQEAEGGGAPVDENFVPTGDPDVNRLECPKGGPPVAAAPLRRLTRQQYVNTLQDLLGDITPVPETLQLPDEALEGGFDNNASAQTSTLALLQGYHGAASAMAKLATSDATRLNKLTTCASGQAEDTCARAFVESFGKRAFRRPLTSEEVGRLMTVFTTAKASGTYAAGIEATLTAMLMSPKFLFRPEYGSKAEGGKLKLSSFEVASRLSYLLLDSMPDADLMAAAEANKLDTAEQVEAQMKRLLEDPRSRAAVQRFSSQWLHLDKIDKIEKDAKVFPEFGAATKASLRASTNKFVDEALWEKGSLYALMTDASAFVDDKLAGIYGVAATADLERVALDDSRRAGILTQAGLMAALAKPAYDSPIHRGLFVMNNLLCMDVPAPPPETPSFVEPKAGDAPKTTRQRVEQTHSDPTCAACHQLIDGIGFGFGHYDAVGEYREKENGFDIDARATLVGTRDIDGPFNGAVELSRKLSQSSQVQQCFATQWYRYALGKTESDDDACALAPIVDGFVESRGDVKKLLSVFVRSDAFRYRNAL